MFSISFQNTCLAYLALPYEYLDEGISTGAHQNSQIVNFEEATNTSFRAKHLRLSQDPDKVATSVSTCFALYNGYFYSIGY